MPGFQSFRLWAACAAVFGLLPLSAVHAAPASLNLCTDASVVEAARHNGKAINTSRILRDVGRNIGVKIVVEEIPWRRCMNEVAAGRRDGLFSISYSRQRAQMGAFPMLHGFPDPSRRMLSLHYHVYRLKGSQVDWNGRGFSRLAGPVGAPAGYSVVAELRRQGREVDDGAPGAEANFVKLLHGRVAAVVLQSHVADPVLRENRLLADRIERVGPPFATKAYYLMLGKSFVRDNPLLADRLWAAIAESRKANSLD
ncbi:substrate-binding periplasmic protein [Paludibacterium paludis]|uniref:Solute-binding protein family 3/N-terminal domain-containing protein n=1 Tax=Paludibacterium paludis TaxID=1225769 RepID=A0A918P5T2_9NEIS|nr:transporter substrate-binding domain-containing protein [Paludibacterium paludis]GGY22672.1 hypothetical protein GCM10011289_28190 [Paludibacterium paludis]